MVSTMKHPGHDRDPYSCIEDRPDYSWPDGKRLAFFVVTNRGHLKPENRAWTVS